MNLRSLRARIGGFVVLLSSGCGGGASATSGGSPGGDDGGGTFQQADGSATAPLEASIEQDGVKVTIVTLSCAGDCAEVEAVAAGGQPPYAFAWEDGSTSATRRVCPTSSTMYSVKVTDTGHTGEIASPATTVQVPLTADVLACPSAGVPEDGGCGSSGGAPPAPGHYAGTITCGAGSRWDTYGAPGGPADGGPVIVGADGGETLGTISLDLTLDPTTGQPTGTWYFDWTLAVIAGGGTLQGTFDCGGSRIDESFVDSTWGLPTGNMTIVPTGMLTGSLTAATTPGAAGAIEGFFTYTSALAGNSPDVCVGSYTATPSAGDD